MIRFPCSHCEARLAVRDALAGRLAACPQCKSKVRVPQPEAVGDDGGELEEEVEELEEVDDPDEPEGLEGVQRTRKKKKRPRRVLDGDYGRVSFGLGFFYASLLVAMVGFLPMLIAAVGALLGGALDLLPVNIVAILLVDWVAPGLGLTGAVLCLHAPRASATRRLTIASLALNAGAVLVGLVQTAATCVPELARVSACGAIPAFALTFAGWCVFMVFLRKLSTHLGDQALAEEASDVKERGITMLLLAPLLLIATPLVCCAPFFWGIAIFTVIGGNVCGPIVVYQFFKRQHNLLASIRHLMMARF